MDISKAEETKLLCNILGIKKDILEMIYHAQSGHPGGSLSCANIIYMLYTKIMNIDFQNPKWKGPER